MNIDYVPLLQIQRDLYRLPRSQDRFRRYLRTLSPDGNVVELPPLVFMNTIGVAGTFTTHLGMPQFPGGESAQFWWLTGMCIVMIAVMLAVLRRRRWI